MQISVVVPTYNRARLIVPTIGAILAQSRPADEVIVVDDGSTDETAAALRRFGAAIRVIRTENGGDLVARNVGLRAATGRLVAFCDSDDLWDAAFLARMAGLFAARPGLVAGYCDFRLLSEGRLSWRTKFEQAPADFWDGSVAVGGGGVVFEAPIAARLLRFQLLFTSCLMVERAGFLALGGWDEGVSRIVGCDLATALRVGSAPPVGLLRAPLVSIRKHGGNYSADTEAMNLGDARVLDYVLAHRPEMAPLAAEIRASVALRRRCALASAFLRRDFRAVREIDRLLPPEARPFKHRVKTAVASLPPLLAQAAAVTLCGVGSYKASFSDLR